MADPDWLHAIQPVRDVDAAIAALKQAGAGCPRAVSMDCRPARTRSRSMVRDPNDLFVVLDSGRGAGRRAEMISGAADHGSTIFLGETP
jgi:hypothetical protein